MVAVLALTGLFLIYLEFFLPGGIMAVGGGGLLILSVFFFYMQVASGLFPCLAYVLGLSLVLMLVTRFALFRLKKGKATFYLDADQEGFQACVYPKEMIGKIATALSDLKPSGMIAIEGDQSQNCTYSAHSQFGYIEKGTPVRIVGGEGSHLIVVIQEILNGK
jgi:membrane-bound serine protease (ClpP class)